MNQPINLNLMPFPLLFSQVIYVARSEQYRQEKTVTNDFFSPRAWNDSVERVVMSGHCLQHGFESWWRFLVSVMEKVLPEVEHLARCCPGTSCPQEWNQSQLAPKELFFRAWPRALFLVFNYNFEHVFVIGVEETFWCFNITYEYTVSV